jgi:hypothetical protein
VHAGVVVAVLGGARQAQQRVVVRARHFLQRLVALAVHAAEVEHHALHLRCGGIAEAVRLGHRALVEQRRQGVETHAATVSSSTSASSCIGLKGLTR